MVLDQPHHNTEGISFLYIAPFHNKSYLLTLFNWSKSRPYCWINSLIHRDPKYPPWASTLSSNRQKPSERCRTHGRQPSALTLLLKTPKLQNKHRNKDQNLNRYTAHGWEEQFVIFICKCLLRNQLLRSVLTWNIQSLSINPVTWWAETNNYTLCKPNKTFSGLNRVTSFGSLLKELQLWGSVLWSRLTEIFLNSIICWRGLMKASIISDMNSSRRFLEAVPVCSNPIVPTQTMYNCVSATSELTLWSIMCWQLSGFVCLAALTGTQKGREVTLKDNLNVTTTKQK